MIQNQQLMAAVSRIIQRAERQEDIHKLVGTYVDVGLLPQLNNRNHQIFYGRRGTGKTHVMKVLESEFRQDETNTVVYIDCRTLGSTSQFSDDSIQIQKRCLSLFRDFLLAIYHSLLEHIIEVPCERADDALEEADNLSKLITDPLRVLRADRIKTEGQTSKSSEGSISLGSNFASDNPKLNFDLKKTGNIKDTLKSETNYTIETSDKVIFPELQKSLQSVLSLANTRLFVLVDEWSSLPIDIQPYLAEFLKRGLLPLQRATLKIGALEHRCRFTDSLHGSEIGFELGADIATAPDLDDYFVYDRNPKRITEIYADVLLKHLASELPEHFLNQTFSINNATQFISHLFTEWNTCAELARASEGVIRDLINIFTQAYFHAQRRSRDSIDKKAIIESARQWFEQDKAQYLDDQLQDVLRRIVDEVIGRKTARSFLLPRQLERNAVIQRLFDARVLHHMQRGYADKDNPGVRYNIYAIDYGAYVDLLGTSKEPTQDLFIPTDGHDEDVVVPFDDKRSIRRIILDASILE